jgi:SAM-dependent methyltransferase
MQPDNFTNIQFTNKNLDRYIVRKSVFRALTESLPVLQGKLLDAGCGRMPYKKYILNNSRVDQYIGLDIEGARIYDAAVKPDHTWDGKVMPFDTMEFDSAFATEVLEHCPEPEVFLKEVHRVLKPEGIFFFTVPFLWNLHEVPYDEYRYTPFALQRHLRNAGFTDITLKALGGWHASLAQMTGLWVRRAPMNKVVRKALSFLLMPLIYFLHRSDSGLKVEFKEGTMITGLYGIARKDRQV